MLTEAIHDDRMTARGNEAVAYSRVTKYLRTAQFDPPKSLQTWTQVHLTSPRSLQMLSRVSLNHEYLDPGAHSWSADVCNM
jgi:hypothetical protein